MITENRIIDRMSNTTSTKHTDDSKQQPVIIGYSNWNADTYRRHSSSIYTGVWISHRITWMASVKW